MASVALRVNGRNYSVDADDPAMPLLYALRNEIGLKGPKFGCGLGQCGACTVIVDGQAKRSCQLSIHDAQGHAITTQEGLGTPEKPHVVQAAFIAEAAAQCGYCSNGMMMTAKALLDRTPSPSEADVREALANNLCRCGSHVRVVRAVMRAAANAKAGG